MYQSVTVQLGQATVTRVTESYGPGFAPDFLYPDWTPAMLEEHRNWMVPNTFDEAQGKFIASVHTWVVRTPHHTILIDTCAGNDKERPTLPRFHRLTTDFMSRLAAADVLPEQVDYVLCTHLHADHCGWNTRLVDGRWVPTFPNAKYVFSQEECAHWSAATAEQAGFNSGVYQDSVLPVIASRQANVVPSTGQVVEGLTFHPTPGHSPGHVAITLASDGREGLFSGDVMHQPIQIYRPDWNSRFCEDQSRARLSRRWVLDHASERNAMLFTAHFAQSSAGHVTRNGDGFLWKFV